MESVERDTLLDCLTPNLKNTGCKIAFKEVFFGIDHHFSGGNSSQFEQPGGVRLIQESFNQESDVTIVFLEQASWK